MLTDRLNPAPTARVKRFSGCSVVVLLLLALCTSTEASFDLGFGSDDDLYHYVTRPELKPARLTVKKHYPDEITPGYWFVAPYVHIVQERFPQKYQQTCQTGPAIYDQDGELVWSGACFFRNQNSCDFRVFSANGTDYLSTILNYSGGLDPTGRAVILDSSLQVVSVHTTPDKYAPFNMHEFKVIENGTKALHIVTRTEVLDVTDVRDTDLNAGLVTNIGAREFDLASGNTTFEWWAHPAVPLASSNTAAKSLRGPFPEGWDWIHTNAVDKNEDGDYLVTGRYTDAIYKVSGQDGRLLWRLGGQQSDYVLEGVGVSGPHDGRFARSEGDFEYISFLDNGGDEERALANISTAYVLQLDKSKKPWTARVVHEWPRPDGGRSDKRGNFQLLDNGHGFVGWSDNSYISEHHPDGRVLMEARFASERFVTYRAYLFNFTTTPAEPPTVKAFAYGDGPDASMSVYYVSWNGATDVAYWNFVDADTGVLVGLQQRSGFETVHAQSRTFADKVYAEAVAKDGAVLRRSDTVDVVRPPSWPRESDRTSREEQPSYVDARTTSSLPRDEL